MLGKHADRRANRRTRFDKAKTGQMRTRWQVEVTNIFSGLVEKGLDLGRWGLFGRAQRSVQRFATSLWRRFALNSVPRVRTDRQGVGFTTSKKAVAHER